MFHSDGDRCSADTFFLASHGIDTILSYAPTLVVSSLHNIPLSSIYSTVDSVIAAACWGGEGNLLWWSGSRAGGTWSGASSFNLLNSHHRETHIVIFIKSAFFIRYYLVKSYITEELLAVWVRKRMVVGMYRVAVRAHTVPAVHRDGADTGASVRLGSLCRPQPPTLHWHQVRT